MIIDDSYKFRYLRQLLVDKLQYKGIQNPEVLNAINTVPRHLFVTEEYISKAYLDIALPIDEGQTISQPYTVAFQTQLLEIKPNEKVLEIGTGSGYQCAILCEIGANVFSIERNKLLFEKTGKLLSKLSYHPTLVSGDGSEGLNEFSPFDKIIVTASSSEIPPKLIEQLKIFGKLVMPVGSAYSQKMVLLKKTSAKKYIKTYHGNFLFIPLIKGELE